MAHTAQSALANSIMSHSYPWTARMDGVIMGGLAELMTTIQEQFDVL